MYSYYDEEIKKIWTNTIADLRLQVTALSLKDDEIVQVLRS
jgi:hypothetical protein